MDTIKLIDKKKKTKRTFAERLIARTSNIPIFGREKSAEIFNVMELMIGQMGSEELPNKEIYEGLEAFKRQKAVQNLLSIPTKFLRYKPIGTLIEEIHSNLLERLETESDDKGNIFEALCIVDRIRKKKGVFQFFLFGAIVRDNKQRKDETEFDIIEFTIQEKTVSECCIYACSISDDFRRNNIGHVTEITSHINRVFKKAVVRSYYIVPENKSVGDWRPKLEQTGRNFNT